MKPVVVVGTDTDVGKTVFAAGLTQALGAQYWKPVQSGLADGTDSDTVAALTGASIIPETYSLNMPASPHLSAEDMGIEIDPDRLTLPNVDGPLVIEGAGGIMVPLNRQVFYLDMLVRWALPVVVVARTRLGTINHTGLTLMALRNAGVDVIGVAFSGEAEPDVEQTIAQMFEVTHLGRIDRMAEVTHETLRAAFQAIDLQRIKAAL